MRRQLKYVARYKPRSDEPLRRRIFSGAHGTRQATIVSNFLNKTVLEVCALCIVLGAGVWLVTRHQFFLINDISITGLDSYAAAQARVVVRAYMEDNYFGVPQKAFIGMSAGALENRLREKVALDSLDIQKIFPHTLRIRAAETPAKMRIHAPNGEAFVSFDGLLVRWYPADKEPGHLVGPVVFSQKEIVPLGVLQPVLQPHEHTIITAIRNLGGKLNSARLVSIELRQDDPERIIVTYEQGTRVIIAGSADIGVQLKKAAVSLSRVGPGKQIDVRFGDKVFVSTKKDAEISSQKP